MLRVAPEVTFALSGGAANKQNATPLAVTDARFDSAARVVHFRLRNDSNQVVTAWAVMASLTDGSGEVIWMHGFVADSYLSAAGVESVGHHIESGGAVSRQIDVSLPPGALPNSVVVQPTDAVFADTSAFGTPAGIDAIFEQRAREERAMREFLGVLNSAVARSGRTAHSALRQALKRMGVSARNR